MRGGLGFGDLGRAMLDDIAKERQKKIDVIAAMALRCNQDDRQKAIGWLERDRERQRLHREDLLKSWMEWFERWRTANHPALHVIAAREKFKLEVNAPIRTQPI